MIRRLTWFSRTGEHFARHAQGERLLMTVCNRQDLSWIQFGFRLGQLTDICRPESTVPEDDEGLVLGVIANLAASVESCGLSSTHQAMLRGVINGIEANWGRRDELVNDHGTAKPFGLIYGE